ATSSSSRICAQRASSPIPGAGTRPRSCALVHCFVAGRFDVDLGAGPCICLGAHDTPDGRAAPTLSGIASMTAGWRLGRSGLARLTWHRSFTQDDQDRDVVTLGVGWVVRYAGSA